jgi:hypothetical protein
MSIAHRIAKVRAHLPAGIELTGMRGPLGDGINAVGKSGLVVSLFVTKGVRFRQSRLRRTSRRGSGRSRRDAAASPEPS